MTNQIELSLLHNYLKRLREMLVEEGRDPEQFKTVLYYGISVNRDQEQAFREAKAFLDSYYLKDFSREGVEIWNACGRSSIASAPSKNSSMLEWITSLFDPSAKTSTNNSRSIWMRFFPLYSE